MATKTEEAKSALPRADTVAEQRIKLAMHKDDLPALAWIMAAEVSKSSATTKSGHISYKVADQIIQKAKALGSQAALENLQTILEHWRVNSTLTSINLYN